MEAVEFITTLQKLCTGRKCYDCPLEEEERCIIIHAVNPEKSVQIVEEWAAEQERQKAEQERQKAEQERQKVEQERQKVEQERQKVERTRQDVMKEITSGILWDGENALRCCPKLVDPAVMCRSSATKCQECSREYWMAGAKTNDRCEGQTTPKGKTGNDVEEENEPSAPEFLCADAIKKTLQDELVLRVIASLTLGTDYERKMEMARKMVGKRMQEDENRK